MLPLRSVTGATPAYSWNAAALGKRSRFSPKATSRRGARAGPCPRQPGEELVVGQFGAAIGNLLLETVNG